MDRRRTFKYLLWYCAFVSIGCGTTVVATAVFRQSPPLSTHRLTVAPNSAATVIPTPLEGLPGLPKLLLGQEEKRWSIVGASLLELGLSRFSVLAFDRALANDQDNLMLHVARGEALALTNGGWVTDEAKAEFDLALQADPNDLIARFYFAHWLLQNGKPKPALVKWVGLMRTVGQDQIWNDRLWVAMPPAADRLGISPLALKALCTAGM